MQFDSAGKERAFVRQRKVTLIRNGGILALIAALMDFASICYTYIFDTEFLQTHLATEVAGLGLSIQLLCQGGLFFVLLTYLIVMNSSCLVNKIGAIQLEALSAALMTFSMLVIVLCSHTNITRMMGYGNEVYQQDFECTSDSVPLLVIDGVITASHVGLPVRWRVLLPMEVIGVFLYAFRVFVRGSCEQGHNGFYNLLCLTGLVITSAIGKRTTESWERQCFETIISERSRRCQAEYQLSQAPDHRDCHQRPGPPSCGASSVPTQTASMKMFDAVGDGVEGTATQLARIAELGRAEHWFIHPKEVEVLNDQRLGQGGFGTVFKAIFCGMVIAVKQPREVLPNMHLASLCNELCILRRLRHPNVITTFGAIVDPENAQITLVMEFVEGATLHAFILGAPPSTECQDGSRYARFRLMLGVSRAILYMHTREPQVVHGDLKSFNIMVEGLGNDANAKILDFGLSRVRVRGAKPLGGTLAWMAPEVAFRTGKVKCSADVFSYGRLLAFIATSILPLAGYRADTVKRMLSSGALPEINWPDGCVFAPFCKKLVEACLRMNEAARPSISLVHGELLELPGKMDLGGTGTTFLQGVETVAIKRRITMDNDDSLLADLPPTPTDIGLSKAPSADLKTEPLPTEQMRIRAAPHADENQKVDAAGDAQASISTPSEPQSQQRIQTGVTPPELRPGIPLIFPGKLPTETEVMFASLRQEMARWNFGVPNGFCCAIHARARMASQICTALLDQPCTASQEDLGVLGEQCGRCGLLGHPVRPAGGCNMCIDIEVPLRTTTAAGLQATRTSL